MHQGLLKNFFENASQMLRPNGEVHVSHKTTPPFDQWNLINLALESALVLTEPPVKFKLRDYPGYSHKRGDGKRCDDHFPLGECSTFKFEFCLIRTLTSCMQEDCQSLHLIQVMVLSQLLISALSQAMWSSHLYRQT